MILWLFSRRPRPAMAVSGVFLVGYAVFRFGVEFVRIPDPLVVYLACGLVSLGQVRSLGMLVAGIVLVALAYRRRPAET